MSDTEHRLRLAIDPYGEHPQDDLDMLLWRAGRMREQIDHAHHWLDLKGTPRESGPDTGDGALTLRGRMDALPAAPWWCPEPGPTEDRPF